jgi:uncharacterized protein YukE
MAIKTFATKDYIDSSVTTEASTRLTEDNAISSDLNTNSTEISDATLLVTTLNDNINTESTNRLAFVDGTIDYGTLKDEADAAVNDMSTAIKVLHTEQVSIAADAANASASEAADLKSSTNGMKTQTQNLKLSIDEILNNKGDAFDTFKELFDITKGNMTDKQSALDALRLSMIDKANEKVNKEQTVSSTVSYSDTNASGDTFNLVITEGNLTLVEV